MDRALPRPRQYCDEYASRFKNRNLAEAYELRPPRRSTIEHPMDFADDKGF